MIKQIGITQDVLITVLSRKNNAIFVSEQTLMKTSDEIYAIYRESYGV